MKEVKSQASQTGAPRKQGGLNAEIQARIGHQLRAMYDDVVHEAYTVERDGDDLVVSSMGVSQRYRASDAPTCGNGQNDRMTAQTMRYIAATAAGGRVPTLRAVIEVGPDSTLLAYDEVPGRTFAELDRGIAWGVAQDKPSLGIMKPYDGNAATVGNGSMPSFEAPSRAAVDAFHRAALAHGGTDEGAPGIRDAYGPEFYVAYVRDPDGNKLAAVCIGLA